MRKLVILFGIALAMLGMIVYIGIVSAASSCTYVSATEINNVNPPEIPKWIAEHYSTQDLCGYFTPDGYFADFFEMDAYYRWKYPDIFDSRIVEIAFIGDDVNDTFFNWYWSNPEEVRAWLRDIWNYPDDWRVLIPVAMKIYYDNGQTVKACDQDVAITQELINEAMAEYSSALESCGGCAASLVVNDPTVVPSTAVNLELVAGILPSFYQNVAEKHMLIFGSYNVGFAPMADSIVYQLKEKVYSATDFIVQLLETILQRVFSAFKIAFV